jgi:hypothetical protein
VSTATALLALGGAPQFIQLLATREPGRFTPAKRRHGEGLTACIGS